MFVRFIVKCNFILLLVATTFAYATNDVKTPCPSINKIQHAAQQIDTVSKSNEYYSVFTLRSAFQDNGLLWFVIRDNISAKSYDEGMLSGKNAIQKVSIRNQINAKSGSWGALSGDICTYGPGKIYALGVHMNPSAAGKV